MKFIAIQAHGIERLPELERILGEVFAKEEMRKAERVDSFDLVRVEYRSPVKGIVRALLSKEKTYLLVMPIGTPRAYANEQVHIVLGYDKVSELSLYERTLRQLEDAIPTSHPILTTTITDERWLHDNFYAYFRDPEKRPQFTRTPPTKPTPLP